MRNMPYLRDPDVRIVVSANYEEYDVDSIAIRKDGTVVIRTRRKREFPGNSISFIERA